MIEPYSSESDSTIMIPLFVMLVLTVKLPFFATVNVIPLLMVTLSYVKSELIVVFAE